VDFADIDPDTYTLCPGRLEEKLKRYRQQGRNVKAVVAVDYAGHPCEWEELQALAKRYEFQLIDDACHALGARYKGVEVCSSRFADAVSLSFHPVKTITTGEGGAVLTNDPRLAERIRRLRTHGMTKDPARLEKNDGPWYYEMHELGFNYRISDIQCALGSSQLARLDRFNQRRREIAAYYRARLDQDLAVTPTVRPYVEHAYHLYPLRLRLERLREDRGHVFNELKARGLHLQVHYIPVHLQPLYRRRFGFQPGDFPLAEAFYQQEISLPIYPDLEDEDLEYIVGTINGILRSLAR
jgi:dTDP-4-amino-4,6-dideoxygalactose transaminase